MMDMKDIPLVVIPKRGSYQSAPFQTVHEFLIEWNIVNSVRLGASALQIEIEIEAHWGDERLSWHVTKDSDQVFKVDSTSQSLRKNRLYLSSIDENEFLNRVEQALELTGERNPQALLQFFEASRWTFARENVYNESLGRKLKEGALIKAPGGYESYNRSRWRVLLAQLATIAISITLYLTIYHHHVYYVLYVGFAFISLLSLIHWSYYRLNAIDATCVIPCLFFPPVGPILVLVWTVFNFVFIRGDVRWFVLRQGHVEFYESWDTPKREPVGVLLLDRYTQVKKSSLFPNQFVIVTPYRSLRLWASCRRERNDWVEKISDCIQSEYFGSTQTSSNDDGILSSFAPRRHNIPARPLVDGRETFEAIYKAISSAKKEIFIAGWMLSPELYLVREDNSSGNVLPMKDKGLFQTRQPTKVLPQSRHLYQVPTDDALHPNGVELTSYDVIVAKEPSGRPRAARWILRGFSSGQWIILGKETNVNMRQYCDAMEPLRFKVSTRGVPCTAFEFSFHEPDDEKTNKGLDTFTTGVTKDEEFSWVNVDYPLKLTDNVEDDDVEQPFTCYGIRLYYDEIDPEVFPSSTTQEDNEALTLNKNDSLMDKFFRLISRTEQESQLDRLYRIFTGRSTTIPPKVNEVDVESRESEVEATMMTSGLNESGILQPTSMFALAANSSSFSSSDGTRDVFMSSTPQKSCGSFSSTEFHSRLDRVIARKVLEEGVKCYILVYRDVDLFLPNASASAKRKLLSSALWNRNIQVIRHAPEGRSYGSIQHFLTCSFSRGKTWWSHHEKLICVDQSVAFVGGLDLAFGRFDDPDHSLWDRAKRIWKGQDYYNPHFKDFAGLNRTPYADSISRSEVPRMPWHDVHCQVGGTAASDLARHFIGRWNAEKRELKPGNDRFQVLLPRYPIANPTVNELSRSLVSSSMNTQSALLDLSGGVLRNNSMDEAISSSNGLAPAQEDFQCSCQVLRSVAPWSSPSDTERSILDSYVYYITNSKRFIYIEQQFFSSGLAGPPVRNPIARTLADRVCRAVKNGETFKVIIVLPVLPAFEGLISDNGSARSVLHWNLRTIRKTWEYINRELVTTEVQSRARDVLGFYSLRKVDCLHPHVNKREWNTEQIYVHSKVLIVDDELAVIGSANLNDRSMLGTRDSEVAALIKDSNFALSLRMKLFREHAGHESDWTDPLCMEWDAIATRNTEIVEYMFPNVPRDSFKTLTDLSTVSATSAMRPSDTEMEELAKQLKGHVVRFPLGFLGGEKTLLPRVVRGDRESVLPLENFT